MSEELKQPVSRLGEEFQQFVAALEPLVEKTAPDVGDDRAFLGRLSDLVPSQSRTADRLSPADRTWLSALEEVVHRHDLSYELVTNERGEGHLWLIPRH